MDLSRLVTTRMQSLVLRVLLSHVARTENRGGLLRAAS